MGHYRNWFLLDSHPKTLHDTREEELKSICDPLIKDYIQKKGLTLINWHSIEI